MTETSVKTNIETYIRGQLNPKDGEKHASPLYQQKQEFLEKLDTALKRDPAYQDEKKRTEKLQSAAEKFDDKLVNAAVKGAEKGGDPNAYKKIDPDEQKQKAGISGMISGLFDMLIGWITGSFSWLWNLIKPMFGNIGDKITDTHSDKETQAAGIANALGKTIEVEGQEFTVSEQTRTQLYRRMEKEDFSKASTTPPSNTPTDTQVASATHDASFDAPNGSLPPPPPGTPAPGGQTRSATV